MKQTKMMIGIVAVMIAAIMLIGCQPTTGSSGKRNNQNSTANPLVGVWEVKTIDGEVPFSAENFEGITIRDYILLTADNNMIAAMHVSGMPKEFETKNIKNGLFRVKIATYTLKGNTVMVTIDKKQEAATYTLEGNTLTVTPTPSNGHDVLVAKKVNSPTAADIQNAPLVDLPKF